MPEENIDALPYISKSGINEEFIRVFRRMMMRKSCPFFQEQLYNKHMTLAHPIHEPGMACTTYKGFRDNPINNPTFDHYVFDSSPVTSALYPITNHFTPARGAALFSSTHEKMRCA